MDSSAPAPEALRARYGAFAGAHGEAADIVAVFDIYRRACAGSGEVRREGLRDIGGMLKDPADGVIVPSGSRACLQAIEATRAGKASIAKSR